jgi:hypothetical protein
MEYDDTITIISGLLNDLFVEKLIESYKNVKHKMITTWNNTDIKFIEILKENGFIIVLSDYIQDIKYQNTMNHQSVCMRNGILNAIDLNYKYVCRSRTDIFPQDHLKFLNVTRELYQDKLMTLCGLELYAEGVLTTYYLEVIICGNIENLLKYYDKNDHLPNSSRNSEQIMIENYTNKHIHTSEDIKNYMNFCKSICIKENIEIIWYRPYDWVDYNRSIPFTKLVSEYCNAFFVYE